MENYILVGIGICIGYGLAVIQEYFETENLDEYDKKVYKQD